MGEPVTWPRSTTRGDACAGQPGPGRHLRRAPAPGRDPPGRPRRSGHRSGRPGGGRRRQRHRASSRPTWPSSASVPSSCPSTRRARRPSWSRAGDVDAKAVVVGPGAAAPGPRRPCRRASSDRRVGRDRPGARLDELVAATGAGRRRRSPTHVAVLCFTSGTAGAPRAAMLTHGNLGANVDQMSSGRRPHRPDDVVLGVLPLFHIFGFNVALDATLTAGARLVLVAALRPGRRHRDDRASAASPSCPAPRRCGWPGRQLPEADAGGVRLRAPGRLGRGQAARGRGRRRRGALRSGRARGLRAHRGVAGRHHLRRHRAAPRLDRRGPRRRRGPPRRRRRHDVLGGDPGEIWVRGPNVFAGYWDDPEATAAVLTADGWLRTGDIAVTDDDGYLYLVDRAKDLIIVSGFNVYPAEVEEVIAEAAGRGRGARGRRPPPDTGEAVQGLRGAHPTCAGDEDAIGWCAAPRPLQVPERSCRRRCRRASPASCCAGRCGSGPDAGRHQEADEQHGDAVTSVTANAVSAPSGRSGCHWPQDERPGAMRTLPRRAGPSRPGGAPLAAASASRPRAPRRHERRRPSTRRIRGSGRTRRALRQLVRTGP